MPLIEGADWIGSLQSDGLILWRLHASLVTGTLCSRQGGASPATVPVFRSPFHDKEAPDHG